MVLVLKAFTPRAALLGPVVLANKAAVPTAVLLPPVVFVVKE